jgi:hypothetical protein
MHTAAEYREMAEAKTDPERNMLLKMAEEWAYAAKLYGTPDPPPSDDAPQRQK